MKTYLIFGMLLCSASLAMVAQAATKEIVEAEEKVSEKGTEKIVTEKSVVAEAGSEEDKSGVTKQETELERKLEKEAEEPPEEGSEQPPEEVAETTPFIDTSGNIALEGRYFSQDGLYRGQENGGFSISLQPEFRKRWR